MDNFFSIVQLVSAFISTVFLPLLLINSQRRKANAEAEHAEANNAFSISEEWKELYDKKDQIVSEKDHIIAEKDKKIDELYSEQSSLRDHNRELQEHISQLKIENQALSFRKCNKRGCPDRLPPSDF